MKQNLLVGLLAVGLVSVAGFAFGHLKVHQTENAVMTKSVISHKISTSTAADPEKQREINVAIESNLRQVIADLRKTGDIPDSSITFRYEETAILGTGLGARNAQDSQEQRKILRKSMRAQVDKLDLINCWEPVYFLKPDNSEYILALKHRDTGENEFEHFIYQDGSYVRVESNALQGIVVDVGSTRN